MKKLLLSLLVAVLLAAQTSQITGRAILGNPSAGPSSYWVTGYYTSHDGLTEANIPWAKYTHMVHTQALCPSVTGGVADGGVTHPVTWDGYDLTQADKDAFVNAAHAAGKKAILGLMDNRNWNVSYPNAMSQATAPGLIATFVSSIVTAVANSGNPYDGIDIDWEQNIIGYGSQYQALVTQLKAALPVGKLITTAVTNGDPLPTAVAAVYASLDQVNAMCYDLDYQASLQGIAWFHGALLSADATPTTTLYRSCWDPTIKAHVDAGTPKAKLGAGVPFYTHRWTGCHHPLQTGCTLAGNVTPYSNLIADTVNYWVTKYKVYNPEYKASYISQPTLNEFLTYAGEQQMKDVATWVKEGGFGGVMTYQVNYESYYTLIGYPLSTALWNAIQ